MIQNTEGEERKCCQRQPLKVIVKGKLRQERLFPKIELCSAEKAEHVSYPFLLACIFLSPLFGIEQEQLLVVLVLRGLNVMSKTKRFNTNITLRSWD